jgi:hypothetical protein
MGVIKVFLGLKPYFFRRERKHRKPSESVVVYSSKSYRFMLFCENLRMLRCGQIFTFSMIEVPPKMRSVEDHPSAMRSSMHFATDSCYNHWVIWAVSHDLRSVGSVYTSTFARRPQTVTILGEVWVFGGEWPPGVGFEKLSSCWHTKTYGNTSFDESNTKIGP